MSIVEWEQRALPRWDDLELFAIIADGLEKGQSLQQIGQDPQQPLANSRMLYLRLSRLEKALGHRLIDRRPWGRHSQLTDWGRYLTTHVRHLISSRREVVEHFAEADVPTLRIVTNGPTFFSMMLDIVQRRQKRQADYQLGFLPDVTDCDTFSEAMSALLNGEADIAFPVPTPHEKARLPLSSRGEILLKSEIVMLCSRRHKRARHFAQQGFVSLDELTTEHIIARPLYRGLFLPHKLPPRWTPITSSVASFAYVQLNLGIGLFTRIGITIAGAPSDILAVPIRPETMFDYWYVQPRKLWRPLSSDVQLFIDRIKQHYRARAK